MQKRLAAIISLFIVIATVSAEIPQGYYDSAIGKSGNELQKTLAEIINHSDPGYDKLWSIYKNTDRRPDGTVWDMYSNSSNFTFGSDQCGNYSGEGDCYNREHSIPKSWRGGSKYSDVHIVVPTDGYVNNRRSNYPFGEVNSSSYVSDNNFSKLGTCKTPGYSGTVFEPNDEYKGDFARIYFYAATRYYAECGSWSGDGFSGSFPYLDEWVRAMMLRWHQLDPVSEKEINRNDAVYASQQGNRNPFVDYPELVDLIFGTQTTTPFTPGDAPQVAVLESPVADETVDMGAIAMGASGEVSVTNNIVVKGHNLSGTLVLQLSGNDFFSVTPTAITADEAHKGKSVGITYAPKQSGNHNTRLTISGGGLSQSVTIHVVASAVESFAAVNATEVSDQSFQANWTRHTHATDYELAVWSDNENAVPERTLFDIDFAQGVPSGWSKTGYTAKENNALRLASGSQNGVVTSPSIDMSAASKLIVTCSPYKTSDNSILYVMVDNREVAQIDCASGQVTQEVTIEPATSQSTISFKAEKSHRVYLQKAQLVVGGSTSAMLDGYPCRVGNVLSYKVEGVIPNKEYYYAVTAYNGNAKLELSNTIVVSTTSDVERIESGVPQGVYVYGYDGAVYIDEAPVNASVYCYTLDGRLCATRTIHSHREVLPVQRGGVYIVQIVSPQGCYATRVMVGQ